VEEGEVISLVLDSWPAQPALSQEVAEFRHLGGVAVRLCDVEERRRHASPCSLESTGEVLGNMRKIARTAAGTVVAFDYFSAELVDSRSLFMRYARAVANATGEPWHFGIDNTPPARDHVAAFLKSCGLTLEEHRNFGRETGRKRAEAGFATATVPSAANR
jgi:hypothetical protein